MISRCCCGRISNFGDENSDAVIINEKVHELLGPAGNFCGPVDRHTIRDMERRLKEADLMLDEVRRLCRNVKAYDERTK